MSYASEEQWTPITCPICGSDIWVMGDKAKPHHCDADPDDDDDFLRQFVDNKLSQFDPQVKFSKSLQDMAKQILRVT